MTYWAGQIQFVVVITGSEYESDENMDLDERDDILEQEAGDADDVGPEEDLRNQVHRVHLWVALSIFFHFPFVFILFHTVYVLCYCNMVVWTWCDWSLILMTLSSFTALTLSFGSLTTSELWWLFGG